jgi:hypothetical protein
MENEAYTKEGREADKHRRPLDKILSPLKSIRRHCIECMGGSTHEPANCTDPYCWMFPFREGHDPRRKGRKRSVAQIEAAKQAGERLRSQGKQVN